MVAYYIAQGKKDETLASLENMLLYLEEDVLCCQENSFIDILLSF